MTLPQLEQLIPIWETQIKAHEVLIASGKSTPNKLITLGRLKDKLKQGREERELILAGKINFSSLKTCNEKADSRPRGRYMSNW